MPSRNFSKKVRISDEVTVEDLINNYAFIQGVIYRPIDPYHHASKKKYRYYTPVATSNYYIADCFVCDINGNHDPSNPTAVPVLFKDLGIPLSHFIKNKVKINL